MLVQRFKVAGVSTQDSNSNEQLMSVLSTMLGNLTFDDVEFSADCGRAANFFTIFNNCDMNSRAPYAGAGYVGAAYPGFRPTTESGDAICDALILHVWDLLNATGIDMRHYTMQ